MKCNPTAWISTREEYNCTNHKDNSKCNDHDWSKHLPVLLIESDVTIVYHSWAQQINLFKQSHQNFACCNRKFNINGSCWIGSMLSVFDAVCGCVMMEIRLILGQLHNLWMWLTRLITRQHSTGMDDKDWCQCNVTCTSGHFLSCPGYCSSTVKRQESWVPWLIFQSENSRPRKLAWARR